jgi:hypothetical protein
MLNASVREDLGDYEAHPYDAAFSDIRQIPGGFEARIALLNVLSNGQQCSSRGRGVLSRPLTMLHR